MPDVLTEKRGAGAFLASEANGDLSRDVGILSAHVAEILTGTVLGKVTATSELVPLNLAAVDGSENADSILLYTAPINAADADVTIIARDAVVLATELVYPAGATDNDKADINAALLTKHIVVR